ncbi:DUF3349 domain-containing protein [Plantibacter sp. VKM Ac-2880]|uniref:DUF3349 domain-containing protein n=1 Tax=Plantibacter sp. VKM Ac-2880 TaxID=2783827 RepID=UPI00188EB21C|nr:DUF3349 domain-containing protein [Plantibacter sp. VKM Ac-2880]MBF4570057.1 DUF3349 domain-containing protein [Plantibacter sp. VKM Ac-2880]
MSHETGGDADGVEVASGGSGVVARVVGWLRAGYPTGVPEHDYVPLLGILRRSLTPEELDQVVAGLVVEAENADAVGEPVGQDRLRARVEQLLLGPALPEDLVRVSARLASAGWPLGSPDDVRAEAADHTDAGAGRANLLGERGGLVARIVRWLRAGYPAGLPEQDFVPLVALLRRRLSDAEVAEVGARLAAEGDPSLSRVDVATAIAQVTAELPSDEDVERVRRSLADHGWPSDFAV